MSTDSGLLPDAVWNRHANPKSGWSRMLTMPVLMAGIYLRNPRLVLGTLAFLVLNPILFSEPDEDQQDDFMYRVVRAEEAWTDSGRPLMGLSYPQLLNGLNVVATLYALYAAVTRKARGTVVGTAATIVLKLWFVWELVRWDDGRTKEE